MTGDVAHVTCRELVELLTRASWIPSSAPRSSATSSSAAVARATSQMHITVDLLGRLRPPQAGAAPDDGLLETFRRRRAGGAA